MISILEETKLLLKQNRILLQKSKGQNFLISEEILEKIIQVANLKPNENVLEIGPGIGTLTKALVKKNVYPLASKKATGINLKTIELDEELIKILKILDDQTFEIIQGDILKLDLSKILSADFLKNYKIVSNLPYNITSRFLRIILGHQNPPKEMILMLQKEVAERIINKDGKWSKLSVMCNFYSQPEYLFTVSKNNFLPIPKVDSAVIRFDLRGHPRAEVDQKRFWQLVKIGFSSKRRTLVNNLSTGLKIEKEEIYKMLERVGLAKNIRAEKLTIENWIDLSSD
ncbi:16S rRNA (adenine(1518)-N(6)/adenine(1519)-N(6))-dimethyltransferase RsmA [bacterium]|nr:16S rRNA (adenine(1518)-N(6)/adenine(1519)-N(6))-dimethyltransferase RsmA [bacterium]